MWQLFKTTSSFNIAISNCVIVCPPPFFFFFFFPILPLTIHFRFAVTALTCPRELTIDFQVCLFFFIFNFFLHAKYLFVSSVIIQLWWPFSSLIGHDTYLRKYLFILVWFHFLEKELMERSGGICKWCLAISHAHYTLTHERKYSGTFFFFFFLFAYLFSLGLPLRALAEPGLPNKVASPNVEVALRNHWKTLQSSMYKTLNLLFDWWKSDRSNTAKLNR